MADTPGSTERSFEALDFIINVLKDHEKNLDKSIEELEKVTQHRIGLCISEATVEEMEQKLNVLQQEVAKLSGYLSNQTNTLHAPLRQTIPIPKTAPSTTSITTQAILSTVLDCKQWKDFQFLAMHPQTLSFSVKEGEKIFTAEVIKGNQIITYTGVIPGEELIKTWLSQQLSVGKQNIFEGSIEKGK